MHKDGQVFRISNGSWFSAQIADPSLGPTGARCSNCKSKTTFISQVCRECSMPFVGPLGFPQYPDWGKLTLPARASRFEEVFSFKDHGRLTCAHIVSLPLTDEELQEFRNLSVKDQRSSFRAHNAEGFERVFGIRFED